MQLIKKFVKMLKKIDFIILILIIMLTLNTCLKSKILNITS